MMLCLGFVEMPMGGGPEKLCIQGLFFLLCAPNISVTKSMGIMWAGHTACTKKRDMLSEF